MAAPESHAKVQNFAASLATDPVAGQAGNTVMNAYAESPAKGAAAHMIAMQKSPAYRDAYRKSEKPE